ncbi:peptidoglycan editing factor PgeF [Fulvivirgaceae bacterium BMA12]|uniref:Purine nucleoside phosphorylase n=1 Tax=Agaribacillus aureus TaxID=3051825 RepID=A0ABT8LC44_9BACT|nr:peptidoglycan editing factor PgeF [Fulvivirgaceae bacterium BMA12]
MINFHEGSLPYYTYTSLAKFKNLTHFTTTRHGGHSQGDFGGLNVSFEVGEAPDAVAQNRNQIAAFFDIDPERLLFGQQIHESNISVIGREFFDQTPRQQQKQLAGTDGLVTNLREVCLCVLSADCAGILLFDPEKGVVAAVHAGWRGTVKKIVVNAVDSMQREFGSEPAEILATICPCIGVTSYEVGEAVATEFVKVFGENGAIIDRNYPKVHVNISAANNQLLIESGLLPAHIAMSETCTFENNTQFYSARRGDKGRFCSGIMMRD